MNLNAEQAAVLARLLPEHPGRLIMEPCAGDIIGQGSCRAFTFQDDYVVAVSVLGTVQVLNDPTEERMTLRLTVTTPTNSVDLERETFADVSEARAFILTDAADRDCLTGPEDPFCAVVADLTGHRRESVTTAHLTYHLEPMT